MGHPQPLAAGAPLPDLRWATAQGGALRTRATGWRLLVVYRGAHCAMCKRYLVELNGLRESFAEIGVDVAAVSADDLRRASDWVAELGLRYPLGHGLAVADMRALGLYVSPPGKGVDHAFAEPAVFATRPRGRVHFACVGNAPYGRPPLAAVLDGLKTAIDDGLPPHGTSRIGARRAGVATRATRTSRATREP